MRLLQVIRENTLNAIRNSLNINIISSQSYQVEQLADLTAALSRQSIVSGVDTDGRVVKPATPVKAWNGPAPTEWTAALSDAIKNWKRSINFQVSKRPDRPLEAFSATIGAAEVEYLIDIRLTSDGYLAMQGNQDDRRPDDSTPNRTNAWSTMEDTKQLAFGVEQVTDMNSFIEGIGWSGWKVIAEEILRIRGQDAEEVGSAVNMIIQTANEGRQEFPEQWITLWRTRALLDQNVSAVVQPNLTSADKEEIPLLPPSEVYRGGTDPFKGLYNYFARIATGLWNKEQYEAQQAELDRERVATTPADEETLNQTTVQILVGQFAEALDNSFWDIVTLQGSSDEQSIEQLMRRITTAADWDMISEAFAAAGHGHLGFRLADEMQDDSYRAHVVTRLVSIRRIMPNRLFAAIRFGNEEVVMVEVSYADESGQFNVAKERTSSGGIAITPASGTLAKDVLFEDACLRAAVDETGGDIPATEITLTRESINSAKMLFIRTLDESYPEMTAFYAYINTVFQEKGAPDIGRARLLGIIAEAATIIQDGGDYQGVGTWIQNEILRDREWLIGDGTENNPGAANIKFSNEYKNESLANDFGDADISEEVELSDEEQDLLEALLDEDADGQNDAVTAILEGANPEDVWLRIYRRASVSNKYLCELLGGDNTFENYIEGNNDNTIITRVLDDPKIPVPVAAPMSMAKQFVQAMSMAKQFVQAMSPSMWEGGTDDSQLSILCGILVAGRDPQHYHLVSEFYEKLPESRDSLYNDIDSENRLEWFSEDTNKKMLAALIGEEATDIEDIPIPQRLRRELDDMLRQPTEENIIDFAEMMNRFQGTRREDKPVLSLTNCGQISDVIVGLLDSDRIAQGTPNHTAITTMYNYMQERMQAYDDEIDTGWTDFTGDTNQSDLEPRDDTGVVIIFNIDQLREIFEEGSGPVQTRSPSQDASEIPTDQEAADIRFP